MTEQENQDAPPPTDLDIPPRQRGRYLAQEIWATDDLGHDLTLEEQLFVRSYMIDRNEVSAMARLGYDIDDRAKLKRMASRYLASTVVQDAIKAHAEALMKKLEISAEHVNQKIADIAFTDLTDVMLFDHLGNTLLPSHLWPEHARTAVKSVKAGQFGMQIEFHDKFKSLDFLAKQTGLAESEETAEQRRADAAAETALFKMMEVVKKNQEQRRIEHGVTIDQEQQEA